MYTVKKNITFRVNGSQRIKNISVKINELFLTILFYLLKLVLYSCEYNKKQEANLPGKGQNLTYVQPSV